MKQTAFTAGAVLVGMALTLTSALALLHVVNPATTGHYYRGTNWALRRLGLPEFIPHPRVQVTCVRNGEADTTPAPTGVVFHAAMVPTPYVMYAPAPGQVGSALHNAQQFREPADLSAKRADEIRVFVTGGSTAWGSCASGLHATISAALERGMRSAGPFTVRVINAGVSGYTTTDERIWITTQVAEYEPDVVVSYSGLNDVLHAVILRRNLFRNLHADGMYYFAALAAYERYNRRVEVPAWPSTGSREGFPRQTLRNIDALRRELAGHGVEYVFVRQPENMSPEHAGVYRRYSARIAEALATRQDQPHFTFIDHERLFEGRHHYFVDSAHFGDRGYAIIAEDLMGRLRPVIDRVRERRMAGR